MTDFCFKSEVTAFDFWKSSMRRTYHSLAGVINIVFTFAMLVMTYKFFGNAKILEQSLLLLGCIWFPVVQPMIIYVQQTKIVKQMPKNLFLSFSDKGLQVQVDEKKEDISWKKLERIVIEPGMVILFSDSRHGYIVTNKNMGQEREAFLTFIKKHF